MILKSGVKSTNRREACAKLKLPRKAHCAAELVVSAPPINNPHIISSHLPRCQVLGVAITGGLRQNQLCGGQFAELPLLSVYVATFFGSRDGSIEEDAEVGGSTADCASASSTFHNRTPRTAVLRFEGAIWHALKFRTSRAPGRACYCFYSTVVNFFCIFITHSPLKRANFLRFLFL